MKLWKFYLGYANDTNFLKQVPIAFKPYFRAGNLCISGNMKFRVVFCVISAAARGNHTMASLPEHQILPPPPPMQHPAPAGDSSWLGVGGGRRDDEGEFGRREMAAGGSGVAAHTTQQFLQPSTEGCVYSKQEAKLTPSGDNAHWPLTLLARAIDCPLE